MSGGVWPEETVYKGPHILWIDPDINHLSDYPFIDTITATCLANSSSTSSAPRASTLSLAFFNANGRPYNICLYSVYPLIDPKPHFDSQSYKGKVIIITGGSTGIGATAALFYAQAGANIVLVARRAENLEERKKVIEKDVHGAQILIVAGDICDPEVGKRAVKTAVDAWNRLDIVLANSGAAMGGL